MFTINLLDEENYEWKPLCFNGIQMEFSSKETLFRAIKITLGVHQQIMYNDVLFDCLNGTAEQYDWFKRSYDRLMNKYKHFHSNDQEIEKIKIKKLGGLND